MIIDFGFFLTLIVAVTGILMLINALFLKRKKLSYSRWWIFEYARTFFFIFLVVWLVRSFVVQPYRVPTGSLEPTVLPGDFILVAEYAYGLHFPAWNKKIMNIGEPKRGDIALFHWPVKPDLVFVKRVIGLPGDHISYHHKVLYVNGNKIAQKFLYKTFDEGPSGYQRLVYVKQENLQGILHRIYLQPYGGETDDYEGTVPKHHYFMMGDNRDNSDDSRQWGFVPEQDLIGKALTIWMSWNPIRSEIRWERIGKGLQ